MVACTMTEALHKHDSVLMTEVLEGLCIKADGVYVDATFGRGGHSRAILTQLGPKGRLIAIDKDPDAIDFAKQNFCNDKRFSIHHGSFANLLNILQAQQLDGKIDGIFLDLGVSSPQLDQADRGFSFMREGLLDMRMDTTKGMSAADLIANISEAELADVLYEYGEERFSRRIAKAIIMARTESPIETTQQLAEIIKKAHPAWQKGKNPATQSFQAIRIAVNNELDDLKAILQQSYQALKIGGRLAVISFHSLEDRIVKQFMQKLEKPAAITDKLPIKSGIHLPKFKKVSRAIKAKEIEVNQNPRARSAVLRIGEKLS